MNMVKKMLAMVLMSSMLVVAGAACGEKTTYPMDKKNETFSIYGNFSFSSSAASIQENYWHANFGDMVGANIEWKTAPSGAEEATYYNMMIASGDLPDIIYSYRIAANNETYMEDKVILNLTELLPKYAPNYYAFVTSNPELDKAVKNDKGQYYAFFHIRDNERDKVWRGPAVRGDWLKEQNLEVPVTIDDWDNMLRVFKEKYGATYSAVYNTTSYMFAGAFGTARDYYLTDDRKVEFGPVTEKYKQFLTQMKKWYDLGYIDVDFASVDDATLKVKVLNDDVSAMITSGGRLTNFLGEIKAMGSNAVWTPVKWPVMNVGDPIKYAQYENPIGANCAVITTACEDVETALRILDYGYSPEGQIYWNFGEENLSFTYDVEGKPHFTDLVLNAADSVEEAKKYIGCRTDGVCIHRGDMIEQYVDPRGVEAFNVWFSDNVAKKYNIPNVTPTYDEQNETASMISAITTYVDEMYFKFIMGKESIDNFDTYVENVQKMGLDRVLEVKNSQVKRCDNR